jgi:cytochrome bd-type quinol oxidase subunit 1
VLAIASRPDLEDWLLLLHLLSASALIGAAIVAATASVAALRYPAHLQRLRRTGLLALVAVAVAAVITIVFGDWLEGREDAEGTWVDLAHVLAEFGTFLVSLIAIAFAWRSLRRPAASRVVAALSLVIVVVLGVTVFVMAAKPG